MIFKTIFLITCLIIPQISFSQSSLELSLSSKFIHLSNLIQESYQTKQNFSGLNNDFLSILKQPELYENIKIHTLNNNESFSLQFEYNSQLNCKTFFSPLIKARYNPIGNTTNKKNIFSIITINGTGYLFPEKNFSTTIQSICSSKPKHVTLISDKL